MMHRFAFAVVLTLTTARCGVVAQDVLVEAGRDGGSPSGTANDAGSRDAGSLSAPMVRAVGQIHVQRGSELAVGLYVVGAAGAVVWRLEDGALPAGVALRSLEGQEAILDGRPTEVGVFDAVVAVVDEVNATAAKTIRLEVHEGFTIVASELPPATVDEPYEASIETSSAAGHLVWSIDEGALPAGIRLTGADATAALHGVPEATGIFAFEVTATNASGTSFTRTLSLSVAEPLSIATSTLPDAILGGRYDARIVANGGAPPLLWTSGPSTTLAPGMTFDATGRITGTAGAQGTFYVQAFVEDADGRRDTRYVFVEVRDSGLRLSIEGPTSVEARACAPIDFELTAEGGGGVGHVWSVAAPVGLEADVRAGRTLRISGFVEDEGTLPPIEVIVEDAAGERATTTISMTMNPPSSGGRWAVATTSSSSGGRFGTFDLCRSTPVFRPLAFAASSSLEDAVFSRSGDRLAVFRAHTSTGAELLLFDLGDDSPSLARIAVEREVAREAPAFAGSRVLFRAEIPFEISPGLEVTHRQVVSLDVTATPPTMTPLLPTPGHQTLSSVSADGRWVVVEDDEGELWITDLYAPYSAPRALDCIDEHPGGRAWSAWSRTGQQLVYQCREVPFAAIDLSGGLMSSAIPLPFAAYARRSAPTDRWVWGYSEDTVTLVDLDPASFGAIHTIDVGAAVEPPGVEWSADGRWLGLSVSYGRRSHASTLVHLPPPGTPSGSSMSVRPIGAPSIFAVPIAFAAHGGALLWVENGDLNARRLPPTTLPIVLGPGPTHSLSSRIVSLPGSRTFLLAEDGFTNSWTLRLVDLQRPADPEVWREAQAGIPSPAWSHRGGTFYLGAGTSGPGTLRHLDRFGSAAPSSSEVLLGGDRFEELRCPPDVSLP